MHGAYSRMFRTLAAAAVLCAVWLGATPAADARVALVVGNSAYQHTKGLDNPSHDAEDMARKLRGLGFEVIEGRNLTQADFYDHLRKFSGALRATKGEAALFFYAGHGMQDKDGKNHLVPVDSPMRDEWDVPKMVRFDYVMDAMQGFSGLKLVFLDACRDNPLRGGRSLAGGAKRGLAPVKRAPDSAGSEESSGTLIMYATAPDDTAADGEGRNSPFTEALLEHVGTPGLEVGEMLGRVVGTVKERTRRTGKQQEPWISASRSGRFFFAAGSGRPEGSGSTVAASAQESTSSSIGVGGDAVKAQHIATEREFWQSIKDSRNPASFRAYLTRYPQGQFAVLAQIRLDELEGGARGDASASETTAGEDRAQGLTLEEGALVQHALAPLGLDPGVDGGAGSGGEIAELTPEMVRIEGGCFQMGSPVSEAGRDDDERLHRVCVEAFSIGKHEVTRGQYAAFVRETRRTVGDGCWTYEGGGWKLRSGRSWRSPGYDREDTHPVPVVCVSYEEAQAYARWLSGETGRRYRLPTEAEWEYAARAGTQTSRHWGDDLSGACEYGYGMKLSTASSHKSDGSGWSRALWCRDGQVVVSHEVNAWELHDMLGNAWEWTCSEYDKGYGGGERRCASGSGGRRVIRGGSWYYGPLWVRSADRTKLAPGYRTPDLGFRLAQD